MTAANWLLAKRSELDVKLSEFNWETTYGLPLFDFEVSILGKRYVGRGTSVDETLAFEKASAEALERLVCHENEISTEGVAAHPVAERAVQLATHEAIERYVFKDHLTNEVPFTAVNAEDAVLGLSAALTQQGASVSWMKMRSVPSLSSSICLIEKNDRFFLGLAVGANSGEIQLHAAIEALRNFAAYTESPESFIKEVDSNPDLWNCRNEFFAKHEPAFRSATATGVASSVARIPFSIEHRFIKSGPIKDLPLHFVQAKVTEGIL